MTTSRTSRFSWTETGRWSLAPAFDVTYSYNPAGDWTAQHQMTMNGKRDGFTLEDFQACARTASLKQGKGKAIVSDVLEVVSQWPNFASDAGVAQPWIEKIRRAHRLDMK